MKLKSCTNDPDEVRPGDVFFALPTEHDDLEELVGLAIHHGCSAVVAEKPVNGAEKVPFYIVSNVGECYAAVCHALHDDPAKSLKMIAISGTSGKTSTSYLVCAVLAEAGYQVGLIGSLGIFDGIMLHPATDTDLQPPQLAAWLHQMMMNGCTHVVVEVPSQMLAQGHLGGIQFDAICLTNIRRDHLEYHKTVEQYRRCQLGIFRYAKKHALAICNVDDRISEAIMPLIDQPMLSVGIRNCAEVGSLLIERCAAEQTFIVTAGTEAVPFQTKVIGDNHIYNCLAATALAIGLEVDIKTIARGVGRVENVPGRMEKIECGQDFNVYIDSARTVDSLQTVLRTVREVTSGRLICVFGTATYHEEARRSAVAKALESHTDSVILTSATEYLDTESAAAACDVGGCFVSVRETKIVPDRAEAVALGLTEAKSGDTVLIFGRGTSLGAPFCDRQFTKQWLQETLAAKTANVS
ncbi:MAG: UDP-N-acetylmuramyl-tripeptide synthetase [Planctomycetaceae bacterium]|nr:UDP-N-acetylmuramyl-tripeptide synthetase [Planctomycetaceae bacterium]